MMRRGACPSLHEPMETGDGLLTRIPLAQGGFAPDDLIALAHAAQTFGNGLIDVSARGNIQIRGLSAQTTTPFAKQIEALNIDIQQGLAIDVNPLAGMTDDEVRDPLPLAKAIRALLDTVHPPLALAPKLSVVIDGGGVLHLDALKADIRLIAHVEGWQIAQTGAIVSDVEAPVAVIALLERVAACGPDARIGALGLSATPLPFLRSPAQPIGHHKLKGGLIACGYALPFGQIGSADLATFARCVATHGGAEIHPALGRVLIVPGLTAESARQLSNEAARIGFITDAHDPRNRITACVGTPACASAYMATHDLARMILNNAPQTLDNGDIHISGCAKGCACASPALLSLIGSEQGIHVVRGGKPFSAPQTILPADEIITYLKSTKFGNTPHL